MFVEGSIYFYVNLALEKQPSSLTTRCQAIWKSRESPNFLGISQQFLGGCGYDAGGATPQGGRELQ
jgi:hypothetical protein